MRFCCLAVALLASTACKPIKGKGDGATVPRVMLVDAVQTTAQESERVTGQLFPSKMLPLGFEVGGRIAATYVVKGQAVKAGALLGQLETDVIDAQVAQATAGVEAAFAGERLAVDVAGRTAQLNTEGTVSDVQSKQSNTQATSATAQLGQARGALDQAKAGQRRHYLRAPFSGTIVDAPDQPGGMTGPGLPVYILMKLDALVFKATISEANSAQVRPGLKVRVESIGGSASTDDAIVKVVIPTADPQTHRVPIEVDVPNTQGRFIGNTLARAIIPVGAPMAAVKIPSSTVRTSGDGVFAVNPESKLALVKISIIERTDQTVTAVPEAPLTRVVDNPSSDFTDGLAVEVQ